MTDRSAGDALLVIEDLSVRFGRGPRATQAVDGVSLQVAPGEVVGVVGESGSGKSVTSMAVLGLLPPTATVSGSIRFDGGELVGMSPGQLAGLRGKDIAMVFQDPMSSLNPVLTVGRQITEVLSRHTDLRGPAVRERAVDLLARVGIPDPARRVGEYPHQLSGGMRQRVMIAIALACEPRLLICDEPTTALDVTIQAQVLELLTDLVRDTGTAMVMITHDLGVVAGMCDQVNVMYSGRIVEQAGRRDLFARPRHRYTEGLLASIPRLDAPRGQALRPIPGSPRDTISWQRACAFAPRCRHATDECVVADLELVELAADHRARCVHPAEPDGAGPADQAGAASEGERA